MESVISNSLKAGASLVNPAQDRDYGYRQATIRDPSGHYWQVQQRIVNGEQ